MLQGNTEYLVLWGGFPKEAATWEPFPDYRLVADSVSNLVAEVQRMS